MSLIARQRPQNCLKSITLCVILRNIDNWLYFDSEYCIIYGFWYIESVSFLGGLVGHSIYLMTESKQTKTPEDIIYEDVDDYNKNSFSKAAHAHLSQATSEPSSLAAQVEFYEQVFRSYYYSNMVLNDSKNNEFFEEALREVHPSVKIKASAKNMLRLVMKVYAQELAETCFEVMEKGKKEDVDQEAVEDATRLLDKRNAKRAKFGKLFSDLR